MNETTAYFECECGGELIAITKWDDGDDLDEIFMSMWSVGHGGLARFSHRLRHIWRIIRKGHPFTDTIVLSLEEARRLASVLKEMSPKEEVAGD